MSALDLDAIEARMRTVSAPHTSLTEDLPALVDALRAAEAERDALRDEVTKLRSWQRTVLPTLARVERAEAALADFRDYGTRFDLHPTHRAGDEGFWHGYLARIDQGIRDRARAAIGGER